MVPLSFKVNLVNDGVSGLVSVTDLTIEIDSVADTERESVENLQTLYTSRRTWSTRGGSGQSFNGSWRVGTMVTLKIISIL